MDEVARRTVFLCLLRNPNKPVGPCLSFAVVRILTATARIRRFEVRAATSGTRSFGLARLRVMPFLDSSITAALRSDVRVSRQV
jgi:hypothetical protein